MKAWLYRILRRLYNITMDGLLGNRMLLDLNLEAIEANICIELIIFRTRVSAQVTF